MRKHILPTAFMLAGTLVLAGCSGSSSSDKEVQIDLSELNHDIAEHCDNLVTSHCMLPFPSNHFTRPDDATDTGLRVNFSQEGMPLASPVNIPADGRRLFINLVTTEETRTDPSEWNRNDGFSPGAMIMTHVPDIDLDETGAVRITDIEKSLAEDAPILVIDAVTGEKQLIWSELDANATSPDGQALIIRPAKNLIEGRRYIVALRNIKNSAGKTIEPSKLFRAYRDNLYTGIEAYENRRKAMNSIFKDLKNAGVDRKELYLAWDFTVASQRNLTERLLHIRDQAFGYFGNSAPRFTVDSAERKIDGSERSGFSRAITGTFQVPNFLNKPGGPTGSRFNYDGDTDPDALPAILNGHDMLNARFRCQVAESTVADFDEPEGEVTVARAALYGHGLFGEGPGGEFRGGAIRDMQNQENIMFCATDWIGMAQEDAIAGVIHEILADISQIPRQLDRSQQGILNFMFLAELLKHPHGFQSHPAFSHNGTLIYDPSDVFYDGNSQGGILGGALIATAPNIHRGVLGVPGSNYSLLLRRYGPFEERFGFIMYEAYKNELDRSLALGLMQMLWDRAENNGYLSHLAGRHLPNTPIDKTVLLHVGLGDFQVTHYSAEIMARTIGAAIHEPTKRLGDHQDDNPYFAISAIEQHQYPYQGHAIMIWDSGDYDAVRDKGNRLPPINNTGLLEAPVSPNNPLNGGNDPHGSPRKTVAAIKQKSEFMKADGAVIDVCGETPCLSDDYTFPR